MLRFLVPAMGLLGVAAAVAQPGDGAWERQDDPQPMGWHLHYEDAMAKLAYGVANSDQLAIMLTCEPGSGEAVIYGDVQPDTPQLMRAAVSYAEPDPLTDGEAYETRIALGDPVLTRLAERGRLRVEGAAGVFNLPATASERALAARFIAHCDSVQA